MTGGSGIWRSTAPFACYIQLNPVKRGLVTSAGEYPYSSAKFVLDESPSAAKAGHSECLNRSAGSAAPPKSFWLSQKNVDIVFLKMKE